jgi:uncharacterized surface protein with fasciclin (FAS1) repeats
MKKPVGLFVLLTLAFLVTGICYAESNEDMNEAATAEEKDIVDTAIAAGNFETLVSAIEAADLVDTLKGEGPFTVFAPDDAAFAKIPAEDLDALIANKTALTEVLTYHVVPGKIMSADLEDGMALTTLEGENLTIKIEAAGVMVDNANVTATDIEASNGVIHIIDTVLMPE